MPQTYISNGASVIEVQPQAAITLHEREFFTLAGRFDNLFSLFTKMRTNKKGKFVMMNPVYPGFSWAAAKSCCSDPTGKIGFNQSEIVPCAVESHLQFCPVLDGTCWEHLAEWRNGNIDETQFESLMEPIMRGQLKSASSQLLELALLAGFHSSFGLTPTNYDGLSLEQKAAFDELRDKCSGLLAQVAKTTRCSAFPDGIESGDCTLSGFDVIEFFDKLICCAQEKSNMAALVAQGYVSTEIASPFFLVSAPIIAAVQKATAVQTVSANSNVLPLLRVEVINGTRVYTYMGVPIVPMAEISAWDKYYGKKTLFGALTVSGNLSLGSSLDAWESSEFSEAVSYSLYREPNPAKKGLTTSYTTALIAAGVHDYDAIVWDTAFVSQD